MSANKKVDSKAKIAIAAIEDLNDSLTKKKKSKGPSKAVKKMSEKIKDTTKQKAAKKKSNNSKARRTRTTSNKLGVKQIEFCHEYIKTGNAKMSYKNAYGCSDKAAETSGIRLLGVVKVHHYINKLQEKLESKAIASASEVLEFLTSVMRGEVPDQWSDKPSVGERNKSAGSLAKYHGLLVEKVKVTGEVTHEHRGPSKALTLFQSMFGDEFEVSSEGPKIETDTDMVN